MTHIVNEVLAYDRKRMKVTLDEGDVTFLLYRGEMRSAGINEGSTGREIDDLQYEKIMREILLPRGKKRAVHYLEKGDRTEFQIRNKLREGFYPESVIGEIMEWLRKYRFADDDRFAENYVNQLAGKYSRREIEAKLFQKGLRGERTGLLMEELSEEDESAACERALLKKGAGTDRNKLYAYLAGRGFSFETICECIKKCCEAEEQ